MANWRRNFFEDELDDANEAAFEARIRQAPRSLRTQRLHSVLSRQPNAHARELAFAIAKRSAILLAGKYVRAIAQMAPHASIDDLEGWAPARGKARCYRSLVTHLFAKFRTPDVWWRGFFDEEPVFAAMAVHVGRGGSPFDFASRELAIPLTRKACHMLGTMPVRTQTLEGAIRWAQASALGLGDVMARTWIAVATPGDREHETFQHHLLEWIAREEPQASDVRTILDWAWWKRTEDGPSFSMKGRTLASALHATLAWHAGYTRTLQLQERRFPVSQLESIIVESDENKTYAFQQVLTTTMLSEESAQMGHCVWSYAAKVESGACEIWRMTVNGWPLVTIEVRGRSIVQARGRFNRLPTSEEGAVLARWAHANALSITGS